MPFSTSKKIIYIINNSCFSDEFTIIFSTTDVWNQGLLKKGAHFKFSINTMPPTSWPSSTNLSFQQSSSVINHIHMTPKYILLSTTPKLTENKRKSLTCGVIVDKTDSLKSKWEKNRHQRRRTEAIVFIVYFSYLPPLPTILPPVHSTLLEPISSQIIRGVENHLALSKPENILSHIGGSGGDHLLGLQLKAKLHPKKKRWASGLNRKGRHFCIILLRYF